MAAQGRPASMNLASDDELAKIKSMREAVAEQLNAMACKDFPEVSGDNNFLRFLRGFAGKNTKNVADAITAFKKMLEWREANKVDAIRQQVKQDDMQKYFSHEHLPNSDKVLPYYPERFFHKTDLLGNPVMVTRQPFITDIAGLIANCTPAEYLEYRIARGEARALLLEALSQKSKALVKILYIWDLEGMSVKAWKRTNAADMKDFCGAYEDEAKDCYPEIAHKLVALHTPWFLKAVWAGMKKLVPKRTLEKVEVLGWGYEEQMAKLISPDDTPVNFLGKCVCKGGCFPEMWSSVDIGRNGTESLSFNVQDGDTFTFDFEVADGGYVTVDTVLCTEGGAPSETTLGESKQYDSSEKHSITYGPMAATGTLNVKLTNGSRMWGTSMTYKSDIKVSSEKAEMEGTAEALETLEV